MTHVIVARGHPMVTARHRTTFMITKDDEVGPRGDCIIGVRAERSSSELDPELKRLAASETPLLIKLRAGRFEEEVRARGHSKITLDHPTDIVVRKSGFVCGRTLAVRADKAAADFGKGFTAVLRSPETKLVVEITADLSRG